MFFAHLSVLITNCKNIANFFANFLQFGWTTISENNNMHFNFKAIYAWHLYGTRGFLTSVTET